MNVSQGQREKMKYRAFSSWLWWVWLGCLWVLAILLGLIGWAQYEALHGLTFDFVDNLYLTAQLVSMNSGAVVPLIPMSLNIARFAFPCLTLLTAIKAFLDVFQEQINAIRLSGLSNHIIVCGLSRKGMLLASMFRQQGDEVVVIEHDEDNQWLESCRGLGIFTIVGDASDPTILGMARAVRARGLFAVCDNDGINADIAMQAQSIARTRVLKNFPQPLVTLVHITDPQLCDLLRLQESSQEDAGFRMELFNVFERAALQLLNEYPAWDADQVAAGREPHLLLVGLGRMGENIITYAARDWHACRTDPKKRLKVTVIDRYAIRKAESLAVRYPQLADDCQIMPLAMEIRSPEFERGTFLVDASGRPAVDRVYVCVDDDALGLHAGLTLHHHSPNGKNIKIVIRMAEENGLSKLLMDRKNHKGVYQNLAAFGYLDHTCTPELLK
jgi:hypothetical protein